MGLKIGKKGQSMVEFVMVLPLFLIILLGMIEFGLIFNAYITIINGAREGARTGSVGGSDFQIESQVENISNLLDLDMLSVSISPNESLRSRGDSLEVLVDYDYKMITPLIGTLLGGTIELQGRTVMRVE